EGLGATTVEETWDLQAEGGDQIRLAVAYERGIGTPAHVEPRIYAMPKPDFYRIYKADQIADVVYSVPGSTNRTRRVEFKAAGPQLAKIFNGSEELVAIVSVPAYSRQIVLPE